ncbi:putative Zn-binding protein involved in type VI secretion [Pseudoduganella lurida]|uniref:Putative Zn-binding protein involved in type VI secretion n=1 Tax=Pseudoduganella lurida TaxID=1036180 RepID=A0A562QV22_9BURK|nr:PAAR domain-containing protein [Pseudoduganella lurida]TWI60625.1 putative Zn-binding protein involved in type VI secretion [Pseudoduganella lurida]
MKNIVRINDPTSHGGKVMSIKAAHVKVDGKAIACVGDQCSCPVPGHGIGMITEGSDTHKIDGVAVAYQGHKTSCGATLISTCGNFSSD